ncbi:delta(14)-sterol reductase like protein [Aureobasidium subglaciale]|nr:delta(14)-sterol reductase like protein [Aureobasidium subglaciale]
MALKTEAHHGYEFGGPLGAIGISFILPIVCYVFAFLCNDVSGCPPPSLTDPSTLTLEKLKQEVGWPGVAGLLNTKSVIATFGYYTLSLALQTFLPAHEVQGTVLASGGRLNYRFNSFASAMFILTIAAAGTFLQGADFPVWTFINDNYIQLLTTNILIGYFLATFCYIRSFSVKPNDPNNRELAQGGTTGNMVYDWFIGRELNPRVNIPIFGEVDIKAFMELRPGLLGWVLLDLAFAARQYGTYGTLTDSMYIVVGTQAWYVLDALWNEPAIMTTMDITTDGFGCMLAFGDLVWVPFIYSIQARYLSIHAVQLGWAKVALIMGVQLTGYYIFRSSNGEKNKFRTNPNHPDVKHLEYIETARGTRLLTSGWWGTARHINYLGDWVMSWAYCLPTWFSGYVIHTAALTGDKIISQGPNGEMAGWGTPITYFYMLYFAVLLIHRERRDDGHCRAKYGNDWNRYCAIVKWKILPGVY